MSIGLGTNTRDSRVPPVIEGGGGGGGERGGRFGRGGEGGL